MTSFKLDEYIKQIRALLRLDPVRWSVIVERQIQYAVLPKIQGNRARLEPQLWELLFFCLDGHEAVIPPFNESLWQQIPQWLQQETGSHAQHEAVYLAAAKTVFHVMTLLREHGVYPPVMR